MKSISNSYSEKEILLPNQIIWKKLAFILQRNSRALTFQSIRKRLILKIADPLNIIGKPTGTQSTPFVLAAHYDTKPGTPGADDNASAVAALLEIARCLADHTFHTPLIFTAFTLEEYGFIGSRHFIKNAVKRNETFSGMISLEMLEYKNSALQSQTYPPYLDTEKYPDCGDFIAVVDNEPSAQLTKSLAEGMRRNVPSLKVETLVAGNRRKLQRGAVQRSCPVLGRRHSSGDGHRHNIFSQSTLIPTL